MQILVRLAELDFLATDDGGWEGVLKHGTYHETKTLGVDEVNTTIDGWETTKDVRLKEEKARLSQTEGGAENSPTAMSKWINAT